MPSATPVLSVVMATRNRFEYAKAAIRSATSIPGDDVEIVVQDNSDERILEHHIATSSPDPRIQYQHRAGQLSMTDNYNLAVHASRGEYICTIGDDDGLNPEIAEAARWASRHRIDCLFHGGIASYYWPDFRSRLYGKRHAGKVYVHPFSGAVTRMDLDGALEHCVRNAAQQWNLPKVYLGLVRRECLTEVRARAGYYFGGVSPDIFGAVAIANVAKRCFAVDYPLVLGGNSGRSNSGLSALRRHKGTLQQADHVRRFQNLDWPSELPRYWVVETALANSALIALRDLGRTDLLRAFNYPLLYAKCLLSHPDYFSETMATCERVLSQRGLSSFRQHALLLSAVCDEVMRRVNEAGRRLLRPSAAAGASVISNLPNVSEAACALSKYLSQQGARFALCGAPQI